MLYGDTPALLRQSDPAVPAGTAMTQSPTDATYYSSPQIANDYSAIGNVPESGGENSVWSVISDAVTDAVKGLVIQAGIINQVPFAEYAAGANDARDVGIAINGTATGAMQLVQQGLSVLSGQMSLSAWEDNYNSFLTSQNAQYNSMAAGQIASQVPGVGWVFAPVVSALTKVSYLLQGNAPSHALHPTSGIATDGLGALRGGASFQVDVTLDSNVTLTQGGGIVLAGNQFTNLTLAAGNSLVYGGAAGITIVLAQGNDILVGGPGGTNTLDFSSAPAGITVNVVTGTAANGWGGTDTFSLFQHFTGSGFDDTFVGGAGNHVFDGSGGTDTLDYSAANAPVTVNFTTQTAANGFGGTDGFAHIEMGKGGSGADTFINSSGALPVTMLGSLGNDSYFVGNAGDQVVENANEGTDTVYSSMHYRLPANVDILSLQGTADLQGYGNTDSNMIYGNSGNNLLDGGAGADLMVGGLGNDSYFVDNAGDQVLENANEGNDTVYSTVHYRLPANVDNLILQGTADLQAYGNVDANTIYGNSGNNLIDGGAGADFLGGGAGNDTYFVDSTGDAVFENANEGSDTIYASVNYRLPANVEVLNLQGTADLQGYGNGDANTIYGNSGNNLIDGGAGADVMAGGAGNDTYFVDNPGDVVVESANQGNDTAFASVNYALSPNVENLIMQGSGDFQEYGNSDNNVIYGNTGNNLINGGTGIDLMVGGDGNDTYFVDDPSDSCFESPNQGTDAVFASCNYGLAADVELLVLQGSADYQAYGNNQVNTVYGNSGNNLINGAGGADTMIGGAGNDTYFVDNTGDVVFENFNEGTDAVFASVNYTLTANVEALVLQGGANLSGTGNALANSLFGNVSDNTLDGAGGVDVLQGNGGNDTFVFHTGAANGDTVVDFAGNGAAAGDSFQFVGFGTAAGGATFTQVGATNQWQIHSGLDAHNEVITLTNSASVHPTDFTFV